MALRHVFGVHPEEIGVVVRVLETHDVHFAAQRNLGNVVYLYRTDAPRLELDCVQRVHHPIDVAAMVHVIVHVEVAVLGDFRAYDPWLDLRVQNVHHLGERVFAWNQGNRVRRVFQIFGLAGFQVY